MTRIPALVLLALLPGPAVLAADAGPPVVYAQKTADYDVTLRIDPALRRYGGLYADYRDGALREFNGFERMAGQMRPIERQSPATDKGPYVERIEYRLVVQTPHLLGVIRRTYRDQHGAQPDVGVSGMILDRGSGHALSPLDLLAPGVEMGPLDAALQAGVDQARARLGGGQAAPLPPGAGLATWDAGRMTGDRRRAPPSNVTLAPSQDGAEAAGGLQFVYSPWRSGPYGEGAYRVVIPANVFAAQLRATYRDDFKGAPAPLPDDPLLGFPADPPH